MSDIKQSKLKTVKAKSISKVVDRVVVKDAENNDSKKAGSKIFNTVNRNEFMAAAETITRFNFAKTQYYRSITMLLIAIFIASFEIHQYLKARSFEPPVKYIPVYEDSTIVDPTPLNKPLMPDSYNKQWLTDAVTDIFTYNYTSIDTHGAVIKKYFTENGYSEFWKQFSSTPDFIRVKNKSMNVISMVIEPPVNLNDEVYKVNGNYAYYEYEFKIRQIFVSPTDGVIPVTYNMVATVVRQDQKLYKSGVAIHSIRVNSSSILDWLKWGLNGRI